MGQENLPWDLVEGKTRADDPRFWPGGAQLSGETFENALIVDVDITAAELIGATFKNCTLARLDLRDGFMSEATFENCIFYKCDLRRADLTNATLKDVTIDRSNLCSAKFTGVQTENFRLMRSEASPCDFRKSKLAGFFSYCDLSAVNFDGADIQHLELFRCNIKFSRVDAVKHECTTTGIEAAERAGDFQVPWFLASATRFEAVPDGNHIEGGYFYGQDLAQHDFKGKTLKNVNFLRSSLAKADFSESVLDNVWLWDCDVDGTSFNKAQADRLSMSHVRGSIQAKATKFDVWNVYESELAESNFEGCEIQAGTISMSMFPNSNFSNIDLFVVESFMTDFTGCDFTGTDLSTQASERSYFDDGINSLPMSQSPLKHVTEAGDINFFYLPISDDKSSTRQKKNPDSTEKEPFQALKDAAPFKGIDEPDKAESKIPVAIPSDTPSTTDGLKISPIEEPVPDLAAPAEPKEARTETPSKKDSKPFDALEESSSSKVKVEEQLSRPTLDLSDAPHIKEMRSKQEADKPKLDIKPEPAAKPEPAKIEPKKESKPKSSFAPLSGSADKPSLSSTSAGSLRPKLSSPSSSLSSKLSGSGPALKKPSSSSLPSIGTGSSFGAPAASTTGPTPAATTSGASPIPSAASKPVFGRPATFGPGTSVPASTDINPSPLTGAPGTGFNAGPPTGTTPPSSAEFDPVASQPEPNQEVTPQTVAEEPQSVAPTAAPVAEAPTPMAAAPSQETVPQTATSHEEPSTDMIHHEGPQPGFFARLINWFKSLFGK